MKWSKPCQIPEVPEGTEKEFWIAVDSDHTGRRHVFLAMYQNRPLRLNENGDPLNDWALSNDDDGWIDSVGWVSNKAHYDYDDFYVPLGFNDKYRLVAWAEYRPPIFNGFEQGA